MLFLHLLQVFTLSTVILDTNSYVLFSANIDDFKNLAKKFVSKNLAVKLTELVNESSDPKRQERDGRAPRKTEIGKERPWQIDEHNNYEHNDVKTGKVTKMPQVKTEKSTVERFFESDRMHNKDYDRIEDSTYPEFVSKRYKTVQRMPTTKDWFEKPPSFMITMNPKIDKPYTPSHSIYYKEPNDSVKPSERDVNEKYEPFTEKENTKVTRDERSNGKQMMQYFPVKNKIKTKKQTNESERGRVNGRDISKIKHRKVKKVETKGDASSILDTVIMGLKKDSYEDYVTPKKDDDYLSDGIHPTTHRRPIPAKQKDSRDKFASINDWSYQRDLDDEIDKTTKSWPILSNIGYGISSSTRKEPVWSVESELIDVIGSSTTERSFKSAEKSLRDRIGPTTSEQQMWEQKYLNDDSSQNTRRPIYDAKREGTAKTTITTEETFPDYIEREWMTTERKGPPENERAVTEREKTTEEYVFEDEPSNKKAFHNKPAYKEKKDAVKARTESLLFDSKEAEEDHSIKTRYTMKGTGMPTREYYKMSSPDYYKKLPRIVEKYDFNEPIPEADREREKIDDRFAQEPARVNKKVRQQREKSREEKGQLKRKRENLREKGRQQREKPQEEKGQLKRKHEGLRVGAAEEHEMKPGPLESILENIGFRFKG